MKKADLIKICHIIPKVAQFYSFFALTRRFIVSRDKKLEKFRPIIGEADVQVLEVREVPAAR